MRKNLRTYWNRLFGAFWPKKNEKAPLPIQQDEEVARFLFNRSQFSSKGIKAAAFLPANDLATSVFRKTLLSPKEYKAIRTLLVEQRGKDIKATALLKVANMPSDIGITLQPEESQHKWHANMVGWPAEKQEQKYIAQRIAQVAVRE